jgi:hypothetical protein
MPVNILLDIGPMALDIQVTQGNTVPWTLIDLESAGVPRDVTDYAYLLTVYDEDWIGDAPVGTPLFQQAAVISDAEAGESVFTPGATDHDETPKAYFHAILRTSPSGVLRTIAKGKYFIKPRLTP